MSSDAQHQSATGPARGLVGTALFSLILLVCSALFWGAAASGIIVAAASAQAAPQAATLTVEVWLDGVPVSCLVDTGASVTLLAESQAARVHTLQPAAEPVTLRALAGSTFRGRPYRVQTVAAGNLVWSDAAVLVASDADLRPHDCVLGMDLLGQQAVTFDWQAGHIRRASAGPVTE